MRLELTRHEFYYVVDILMRDIRDRMIPKKQTWYVPTALDTLDKLKKLAKLEDPGKHFPEFNPMIKRIDTTVLLLKRALV